MPYWVQENGAVVIIPVKASFLGKEDRLQWCRFFSCRRYIQFTAEGILAELIRSKQFQTTDSSYYVFGCEKIESKLEWQYAKGVIALNKQNLFLENKKLFEECFIDAEVVLFVD